jgi:AraC-like DNA-binding protein
MQFVFRPPIAALRPWCNSLTFYAGAMPVHARERLLPDGSANLLIDLGDRPKRLFDASQGGAGRDFRRAWMSGLHRRALIIEAQLDSSMLVINLRPVALRLLTGHDASALAERVEDLSAVIGAAAEELRGRVLEAPSAEAKLQCAEDWMLSRIAGAEPPAAVGHAFARLAAADSQPVSLLAEEAGLSDRQLRNLFDAWVGVSPKQYQRLARFQRLLLALSPGRGAALADINLEGPRLESIDWAWLAASSGYADQSHLVHEFSAFAGITPSAYAAEFRGLSNFLPIGRQEGISEIYKTGGQPAR